jgi:S1-C subfamily serine protease
VIGGDGRLLGIGSLLVQEQVGDRTIQGNMIVPIDLLEPILDDMVALGRANRPPRPWLGMYTTAVRGHLVVAGLAPGGPAERAAVQVGDLVLEVAGERVSELAELFRKVWRLGPVGTAVPLTLAREGSVLRVELRSADRQDFLKKPQLH